VTLVHEPLVPGPAQALAALLDRPLPVLDRSPGLPLLWHWVYLLDRPGTADLGPDGHRARGGVPVPPAPGLRRMFAGGRVERQAPLLGGQPASRSTSVIAHADKVGRSGPLTFVTVRHVIRQLGEVVLVDEQDLVYRRPTAAIPAGPAAANPVDPVLLFRFSALTYNGHRIHYDRDYARDVEGYPGLVVHGPLQALLMAEALRERGPVPARVRFEYRLVAPLCDRDGLVVHAAATQARVEAEDGRVTATARLSPR